MTKVKSHDILKIEGEIMSARDLSNHYQRLFNTQFEKFLQSQITYKALQKAGKSYFPLIDLYDKIAKGIYVKHH